MPQPGLPPWHLWGSTETVTVPATGPATVSEQLARISYRRPETWRFFLAAEIVGGTTGGLPTDLQVDFQLQFGVGRAVYDTEHFPVGGSGAARQGFCEFRFLVPGGTTPGQQAGNKKFATRILGPIQDDTAATPADTRQPIELIVAQDIQCSVTAFAQSSNGPLRVKLYSFFAPNVHVRPDWYADGSEPTLFRGNETGGT